RLDRSGPAELGALAAAVDELAERRQAAETEVDREVRAAKAAVEQERNRLAALMADLDVAVLVCSLGGRVLLYNAAARALLHDDPALGLGRSVFGIVDRGLITHALERVRDGSAVAPVSTALREGQLLQVRLTAVTHDESELAGFVLVLEDMTAPMRARQRRDALLRGLTETTRASLASIRAAVETVLDYQDMEPEERRQFVEIVREESQRLGEQVEGWVAEAGTLGGDWFLTDMAADDLVAVLARDLERETSLAARTGPCAGPVWVRVDSSALARALAHLGERLRATCGVEELVLSLQPTGGHGRLEARWSGPAPDPETFRAWLDEPPATGPGVPVREVVERHDAEIWAAADPGGGAHVRLLLPLSEAVPRPVQQRSDLPGRPEYYDFDLFDLPEEALAWQDRPLSEVAYTVFDTETTGFHPDQGDEIVALGAVRVVNGRLLRSETFERLVDPGRRVPAAAIAVHGITNEMVQGQPPLEQVLPLFARFADGTVLVGHNVAFDLSFLRAREPRTGVRFAQPVLDTLLLDAAVHPDHEQHSLEAIAARLGIDVLGRHTALGDALLTGEVFVRLLGLLQQRGITTVGQALAASRETYHARLDARLYGASS
ncbi:MAG: exonuclease domain-containing protein, partial [Actinomycetota bacterium]|nr:exonuclease domain-containing protein [Actinomycetota bacterium]